MRPYELTQMAYVARQYYHGGRTIIEIAADLQLSRFKVARILAHARENEVVKIRVNRPGTLNPELSERLENKFCLMRALVTTTGASHPDAVRNALGRIAAPFLADTVTETDVLGFSSGRTLNFVVDHLETLSACEVVQLTGMAGDPSQTSSELVRRVCEISGGKSLPIYAPLVVSDARAVEAFMRQSSIRAAYDRFPFVTKAVLAVGSWDPPDSQLSDALNAEEREGLLARGVSAEISAGLLTAEGVEVPGLEDRTLAITLAELRKIPEVIVIAGGAQKVRALRAVLRTGVVTSLITDTATAEWILT